jgi:hypothetical protein
MFLMFIKNVNFLIKSEYKTKLTKKKSRKIKLTCTVHTKLCHIIK